MAILKDRENFRDICERVSGYYFADRYPPLGVLDLTCEDVKKDLKDVRKFIRTIRGLSTVKEQEKSWLPLQSIILQ